MVSKRHIHTLAREQAAELLGLDQAHQRRIRSAEGMRFAFSELPVPGFRAMAEVEDIAIEPSSLVTYDSPELQD